MAGPYKRPSSANPLCASFLSTQPSEFSINELPENWRDLLTLHFGPNLLLFTNSTNSMDKVLR